MEFPARRRPVHFPPAERHNRSVIVFVTVCTKGRKPWLASNTVHDVVRSAWISADRWMVGRYVLLPDHIHFFCSPGPSAPSLTTWISFWKRLSSRQIRTLQPDFSWQRSFWDTQLRRGESYSAKWQYVRNNPVRHNLVASADQWLFQGEITELVWHD